LNKKSIKNKAVSTSENSSLMLKMVSSYSLFLLIILVLFWVLYSSSLNNMRNSYNSQNQASMMRDVEFFEHDLYIMDLYCCQLLQNSSFRAIMNLEETSEYFFDHGQNVKTSLSIDIYPETLLPINEVYVYLPLTDYILCPGQYYTADFFYNKIRIYPEEEYENWISRLTAPEYQYCFTSMKNFMPHSPKNYYSYVLDLGDLYFTDVNASVCFIIDGKELTERFHILDTSAEAQFLTVYNKNGTPILSLQNTEEWLASGLKLPQSTDEFCSYEITEGTFLTIGMYVSENTGNTYYYSFPSFDMGNTLSGQLTLYVMVTIFALLLGGSLIIIFSRRNVAPIVKLGEELQVVTEEKSQLQEVVNKQKPIIVSSYIQQLLVGSVSSEDEMQYIKEYLELPESVSSYNIIYIVAYNNSENATDASNNTQLSEEFEAIILNSLEQYFGEPFFYYSPAARTYALLLTGNDTEVDALIMKAQKNMVHMHQNLFDTYGIWTFAGMGHTTDSLMNVWESYQQAMEAASYTTKNYIFVPYEIIKKESNAFYYPPELSTKLIHFITAGNKSQVLELFGLIHQENIEERSLPINLLQFLMQDIRNTLLKARFALPTGAEEERVQILDELFNEHLSFKLCEDIALQLCELFQNGTEDTNLIDSIEKYIVSNYKDSSLGLTKISDEFHISESYFSHMFKEKKGVNFSVYLESIRMNEAAKLIQETDINLSELYIEVGYNNAATFRRAFKKNYGITPSAMRESAGH